MFAKVVLERREIVVAQGLRETRHRRRHHRGAPRLLAHRQEAHLGGMVAYPLRRALQRARQRFELFMDPDERGVAQGDGKQ
ncbi:MAG TPA: hypothetical protein VHR97_08255 [Candidatus Baltobacteraceae bacterium]|jgi:hypothetical protein|nr:hypothetical protein [Candidatus Baltobacteraceae bacterium]